MEEFLISGVKVQSCSLTKVASSNVSLYLDVIKNFSQLSRRRRSDVLLELHESNFYKFNIQSK
jgi:hypothetical protein